MRSILDAGFIFWGLFLAFGLLVLAYVIWMRWEEGKEGEPDPKPEIRTRERGPNP